MRIFQCNTSDMKLLLDKLGITNLPPNVSKASMEHYINEKAGYELIRHNDNNMYWFTSAFFNYYLKGIGIELKPNEWHNWRNHV